MSSIEFILREFVLFVCLFVIWVSELI